MKIFNDKINSIYKDRFSIKGRIGLVKALCLTLCSVIALGSCKENDPNGHDKPGSNDIAKRTLLVYAVASNNLWYDFKDDANEMLLGMEDIDLDLYRLLVYRISPLTIENPATGTSYNPALLEAKRDSRTGKIGWEEIKTYSRNVYSTDPQRLSEVVDDMTELAPADNYGLILWSHGLGWLPAKSVRAAARGAASRVVMHSFGSDEGYEGIDEMNIDELASALPDNTFDFIWFDACYMAGIETVYQLRDKCERMVAYPTEIWSNGMPYDRVLPYMMNEEARLTDAARVLFEWFAVDNSPATVSVINMSGIEELADAVRDIYQHNLTLTTWQKYELQYYSRRLAYPFYDLGQQASMLADDMPSQYKERLEKALASCVEYKAISEYSFDRRKFDAEVYSGLTTHYWRNDGSETEAFYTTLDWYKRVY